MPDQEPDFVDKRRVAIVGLGLMGGSLALALQGKCAALMGVDRDPNTLSLAKDRKVFDVLSPDLAEVLPSSDLIILATPVNSIISLVKQLPDRHPGSAMVLDLGSTKTAILEAMQELPDRFDPVGGHPMCGRERSGFSCADPQLFTNATFAFTPLQRTSPQTQAVASSLARLLGAHPLWIDPHTHDRWVAATSHLPYLLANVLALATPPEAVPLAGPGFRSTSRLAGSSLQMMLDILTTNREPILEALERFDHQLDHLYDLLMRGDFNSLQALLAQGTERYKTILDKIEEGTE